MSVLSADEFPTPRDCQVRARDQLRAGYAAGHRCQMLMMPTGAGKTITALWIIREALAKARRAIFVADRTVLINQTSATADRYGMTNHGVIQAQHWRTNLARPFQIASAQTLARRNWPEADLIIVDEAHTQLKAWTEHIPNTEAAVIGLSATPFSAGLGKLFTNLVNAATMHELTEQGVLVPMRVFHGVHADMRGAETAGGEWTDKAVEERGLQIVGDVVAEWMKHGENRKTICFASTIRHCDELCQEFNEAGIGAAVFTSETPAEQREVLASEFKKPDSVIRVLISVAALAKGFDQPDVGCVILARPLRKSLSEVIQMVGRGLRSSPETGKADCLVLDHAQNMARFAEDFEDVYFNGLAKLDDGEKLDKKIRRDEDEQEIKKCPKCGTSPFARRCRSCGFEIVSPAMLPKVQGELQEVMIGKKKVADDRRHLWEQLVTHARATKQGETQKKYALALYKQMTGVWPAWGWGFEAVPDVPITANTASWIRSNHIRRAKAREKAAA